MQLDLSDPRIYAGVPVVVLAVNALKAKLPEQFLERKGVQYALPWAAAAIGALLGLIPGVFPGEALHERVVLGTIIGMIGPFGFAASKRRGHKASAKPN